jgi:hypothetical protein
MIVADEIVFGNQECGFDPMLSLKNQRSEQELGYLSRIWNFSLDTPAGNR